jgi:hypothetical protein
MKFVVMKFILAALFAVTSHSAHAQTDKASDKVAEIRRLYAEVSEKLKRDAGDEPELYRTDLTVSANSKPWAAVGYYRRKIQFWFEITDETRTQRLVKIHESFSVAARSFTIEYLFAPAGELVFYFIAPDDPDAKEKLGSEPLEYVNQPQIEVRCYYAGGKAIRIVKGAGKSAETKQDAFAPLEKELAADGQSRAKLLKSIFAASVQLN